MRATFGSFYKLGVPFVGVLLALLAVSNWKGCCPAGVKAVEGFA